MSKAIPKFEPLPDAVAHFEPVLTVPEFAAACRTSPQNIYAQIKKGLIPAIRLHGMLRITQSTARRLLTETVSAE